MVEEGKVSLQRKVQENIYTRIEWEFKWICLVFELRSILLEWTLENLPMNNLIMAGKLLQTFKSSDKSYQRNGYKIQNFHQKPNSKCVSIKLSIVATHERSIDWIHEKHRTTDASRWWIAVHKLLTTIVVVRLDCLLCRLTCPSLSFRAIYCNDEGGNFFSSTAWRRKHCVAEQEDWLPTRPWPWSETALVVIRRAISWVDPLCLWSKEKTLNFNFFFLLFPLDFWNWLDSGVVFISISIQATMMMKSRPMIKRNFSKRPSEWNKSALRNFPPFYVLSMFLIWSHRRCRHSSLPRLIFYVADAIDFLLPLSLNIILTIFRFASL